MHFFSAFKSLDFTIWLNNKNSYHHCCSFPNSIKPLPEFPSGIALVYEQIVMTLSRQMWQNEIFYIFKKIISMKNFKSPKDETRPSSFASLP